jgi:hypothetical protein
MSPDGSSLPQAVAAVAVKTSRYQAQRTHVIREIVARDADGSKFAAIYAGLTWDLLDPGFSQLEGAN